MEQRGSAVPRPPVMAFMAGTAKDFHGLDAPVAVNDRFQYHFALHPIEPRVGGIPLEFFHAAQDGFRQPRVIGTVYVGMEATADVWVGDPVPCDGNSSL